MGIRIISFTEKGRGLSQRLAGILEENDVRLFVKYSGAGEGEGRSDIQIVAKSVGAWAREQMEARHTLLFIGACGIAVRAIAPCIIDKLHDSAVLVMDERGEYVIPILAGHVGGANEIAIRIAQKLGACPVLTTATDINGRFAVDLFAKRNGFHIENKDGIAKVSARVLAGKEITMLIEAGHMGEKNAVPEGIRLVAQPLEQTVDVAITAHGKNTNALLLLTPKEYVIGMGCRRGKEEEKINELILKTLDEAGISKEQIYALASIEHKKDEAGLSAWCRKADIPFVTFAAEKMQELKGNFSASAFVQEQVGVDNVCERAALMACGQNGILVLKKRAEDGMTIAIAKREWSVVFDEP